MADIDEATARLAEPQPAAEVRLRAWYMDDSEEDQRLPHQQVPNAPASVEDLRNLGVVTWTLDADIHESDPKLQAIRKVRGYNYKDIITVSPSTLPNYEAKIKDFFEEHIHDDEEIRYILDGSGYFDVRDQDDRWIRIECKKGDMLVLPEGIYHRFTLDANNYAKAMRLFAGDPVWTPINREGGGNAESHVARKNYLDMIASLRQGGGLQDLGGGLEDLLNAHACCCGRAQC